MTADERSVDALVEALASALKAERQAVAARRAAGVDAARAARTLLERGLTSFRLATRVSRRLGERLDARERRALGKALLKRVERDRLATERLQIEQAPHCGGETESAPCTGKEETTTMPTLLKRVTVTETYELDTDDDGDRPVEETEGDDDDDDEDDETERAPRGRKAASKRDEEEDEEDDD